MVSQAKVNPNGKATAASDRRAHVNPAEFAHDAIELGELQFRLLVTDFNAATRAARIGVVLLVAAAGCLIAAAPILLLSLAAWMESKFAFSHPVSLLIAGAIALALSAILFTIGWGVVQRGAAQLDRSRQECQRNLNWVKQMLSSKSLDAKLDEPNR